MVINRRKLITGLISFIAAPAIVRAESLMKLPRPQEISLRKIVEYTIDSDQLVTRIDVLYCRFFIKPEWCIIDNDS